MITEALAALMDNSEFRRQMTDKSLEIAKSFKNCAEVGHDLAHLIEKLVDDKYVLER